jgi:tRNA pseudouridine13 synthase
LKRRRILPESKLERSIGLEVYATKTLGIGGSIRQRIDDFTVEEVLVDGSEAKVNASKSQRTLHALHASNKENRYFLSVLIKRNWDTLSAIKAVANQLGVSVGRVQIGGIKDARAVTAQYMTIQGASASDLEKIQVKDMNVYPVGYVRNKLSSYYLLGNHFQITVRNVRHPESTIGKRIARILEELEAVGGIPNFFGHQRFGTVRPITHLVGKALVKGDFKKAAMIFLAKASSHEHPQSRCARNRLRETRDFERALQDFPQQLRYERLMIRHLIGAPGDFAGAFKTLPVKLQELFPQAYQSFLFNKFLSKRIDKKLPLNSVEVGDYVVSVEQSGLPVPPMYRKVSNETLKEINVLVKAGKMRLAIPLVGFGQNLSSGMQGEMEDAILEEEGMNLQDFRIAAIPKMSMRGELRTALAPLKNFSPNAISEDLQNTPDARAHRVSMSFFLQRGSYATTLLREFMKPRNLIEAGF